MTWLEIEDLDGAFDEDDMRADCRWCGWPGLPPCNAVDPGAVGTGRCGCECHA